MRAAGAPPVRLASRGPHDLLLWAYDFVEDPAANPSGFGEHPGWAQDPPTELAKTPQGFAAGVDEFTRECLAIRVGRKLGSADVPDASASSGIDVLADLFIARGTPSYVRSDNGPEFIAMAVKGWISGVGIKTAFIEPGSPWENGYVESFNGKLRDELLNTEVFNTLAGARVLIEQWRQHYNTARPHSSLRYRPPAPEVFLPRQPVPPASPAPAGSAPPSTAELQ